MVHTGDTVKVVTGAVREPDKDKMTFLLRSEDHQHEWSCRFSPVHRDDVMTAFTEEYLVSASGRVRSQRQTLHVIVIEPLGA